MKVTSVNAESLLNFRIVNIDVHKNTATIENPYVESINIILLYSYTD